MYAIYRIDNNKWFAGLADNSIPVWTNREDDAKKYPLYKPASMDEDYLRYGSYNYAVIIVAVSSRND